MSLPHPGIDVALFLSDFGSVLGPIVVSLLAVSVAIDVVKAGIAWARVAFNSA